jgi:hypothetical protein
MAEGFLKYRHIPEPLIMPVSVCLSQGMSADPFDAQHGSGVTKNTVCLNAADWMIIAFTALEQIR